MALFTDAEVIGLDDLLQYETSLVQISSTHAIDVTGKINLATGAIADTLMLWLLNVGASDPQWLNRRLLGLSTIVVTPTLERWVCFESLCLFFAEAYNVQLNTRFQGKWTEYQQQSANAQQMVFMTGLGIVYNPLPKPALPIVSFENGNPPTEALYVQTAWVDTNGDESALSPVNAIFINQAASATVSMRSGTATVPAKAIGWNLYAGTNSNDLTRQNNVPFPLSSVSQISPSTLIEGPEPVNGQNPDFYITLSKQIRRG